MTDLSHSSRAQFDQLITQITGYVAQRPLDQALEDDLNTTFPAEGGAARSLMDCCRAGVAEGWLCAREAAGIRFGRVIKPTPATEGFSVDVVEMSSIVGPHHAHPNGEIDFVMPLDGNAQFDGRSAGWLVYRAGSAHSPTVTNGRALVLYLLPQGAIDFQK